MNGVFEGVHEHGPWSLAEKLRVACNLCFLFERVVGSPPDEFQRTLLEGIAAAANDVTLPNRSWHVNCSRQMGKSTTTAVAAAWVGCYSAMRGKPIVIVSPSDRQSVLLLKKTKQTIRSLSRDRANEVVGENQNELILRSGTSFVALPSGEDGDTLRAFSAVGLLIADEATRVTDSIFQATLPMLAVSRGLTVLLSTPNSRLDWFGRLDEERPPGWEVYLSVGQRLPAILTETLAQLRRSLGKWRYAQEMEGSFNSGDGGQFFDPDAIAACSPRYQHSE